MSDQEPKLPALSHGITLKVKPAEGEKVEGAELEKLRFEQYKLCYASLDQLHVRRNEIAKTHAALLTAASGIIFFELKDYKGTIAQFLGTFPGLVTSFACLYIAMSWIHQSTDINWRLTTKAENLEALEAQLSLHPLSNEIERCKKVSDTLTANGADTLPPMLVFMVSLAAVGTSLYLNTAVLTALTLLHWRP